MAKKILIVDDDPYIVHFLTSRLRANQYEVSSAKDGREGLEAVKKSRPDLILVDIMMPEMDGYTFVRTLRREEDNKSIPLIVISAKDKMQELFALEGVKDYVVKPFEPQDLLSRVQKCLQAASGTPH